MRYLENGQVKPHYIIKNVIYDGVIVGYRLYEGNSFSRYLWFI